MSYNWIILALGMLLLVYLGFRAKKLPVQKMSQAFCLEVGVSVHLLQQEL